MAVFSAHHDSSQRWAKKRAHPGWLNSYFLIFVHPHDIHLCMDHELFQCTGFQWDDGNSEKNWFLHQVTRSECEQIFFNQPFLIGNDEKHSTAEK